MADPAVAAAYESALRAGNGGDFIQDADLTYTGRRGIFADQSNPPDGPTLLAAKRALLADGQPRHLTVEMILNGQPQPVALSLAPIRGADGSVSGLVGIGRILKDEAGPVAGAQLFAKANHDLRQPFQAMRLFLHLLEGRAADQRQGELIQRLGEAVDSASHQVASLLDLSTLQAGTAKLSPGPIPLAPLLARLTEEYQEQAQALGVTLRHVPSQMTIVSDGMMLDRLLRQLLDNALRHAGPGGKVVLGVRRQGHLAALTVLDNGKGIAPEDQQRIFQAFVQLEDAGHGRRGLGLGLAIVRHGAQVLGHDIRLHSQPGKGSRFMLRVPRHGMKPPAETEAPPPAPSATLVAVVEDDRLQLAALEVLLQEWGYDTAVAGSRAELETILAGRRPGLIITDLHLPGGQSGPDLVIALRARHGAALPALLLTGDGSADARRQAQLAGMTLLGKPVFPARLQRAVAQALGETTG
jgi:signal transduction histidine kinase/CheY-like chemotaxis protein